MAAIEITVFFATNRNRLADSRYFGTDFAAGPTLYRVGRAKAVVDISVDDRAVTGNGATLQSVQVYRESRTSSGGQFRRRGTEEMFPELVKHMREERCDAICFVPGFNYSFTESLERAALLAALYSRNPASPLVALVFSWPSDGSLSVSGYLSDRVEAELSGFALARAAERLIDLHVRRMRGLGETLDCGQRLHLVAHSMGAHALSHAVSAYGTRLRARLVRVFDTAIIAAADTERDALERSDKMANLTRLSKSVHCYVNAKDKPLEVGDEFDGPPDRLGSYGPSDPDLATSFSVPLAVIDCSSVDVPARDLTRHQYYRLSPRVIQDIREVIDGREADEFSLRWFDEKRGVHRLDDRPSTSDSA